MASNRNTSFFRDVCLGFIFIILFTLKGHALQFSDIDTAIQFQTNVINSSYDTSYVYGCGDDEMDCLAGLSLKACLSWINSEKKHIYNPIVFYPYVYGREHIGFSSDATPEEREKEQSRCDSIFNSQPFRNYPGYIDCKISEFVNDTTPLIAVRTNLRETLINIRILVLLPETFTDQYVTFSSIFQSYDYELKINERDSVQYLIDLFNIDKLFFVDDEGLLNSSVLSEFSWRLSDLSIYSETTSFLRQDLQDMTVYDFFLDEL